MDGRAEGLAPARRTLAATAIWTAMAITVLDTAIVNVALPSMAQALRATPSATLWVVHGYQLAIVTTLLALSAAGDAWGYRRVYLAGLVVFIAASLGCCLARSWYPLVALRVVQGLGAAAIMSVNGALVRHTFPAGRLGWAMGINALVIAASALAAPALGGAILSLAGWPWLFGINLVLGPLALAAGWRNLPGAHGSGAHPDTLPDPVSVLLSMMAMASLFGGAAIAAQNGEAVFAMASLAVFAGTIALLWRRSRNRAAPLLPVDLMARPALARAYLGSGCQFAAQALILSCLPFYLRHAAGYPAWLIGLCVGAVPLGLGAVAPRAGRMADSGYAKTLQRGGMAMAAAAFASYALMPLSRPLAIAGCGLIAGAGIGLFQAPNSRRMMAGAPRHRAGAAAGMLALSRLSGQIGGIFVAGCLFRLFGPASSHVFVVAAAIAAIGSLTA